MGELHLEAGPGRRQAAFFQEAKPEQRRIACEGAATKKKEEKGEKVQRCPLCKEHKGTIKVQEASGSEVKLCLRCYRVIQWH